MALRWFDSFDGYATTNLGAHYGLFTGTIGATGRNGTNALRDPNGLFKPLPDASGTTFICGAAFTWRTSFSLGFPIEVSSNGSSDIRRQCYLKIKASGKLSANEVVDSSATLSLGVTYFIQLKAVVANSPDGSFEVRVRDCTNQVNIDVSDLTLSATDTQSTAFTGWDALRITCTNVDLEDLYVADGSGSFNNDFLNDTAIDALIAQADSVAIGFNTGWTTSTGTDHGALVDDVTPNGDTDYVSTATVGAKDTYNLPGMSSTGSTRAIKANFYATKTDHVQRSLVPVLRILGADYEGTAMDVPIGYEYLTEIFETNPLTGSLFTNSDIAGMQLGQKLDTATATKFYLTNVAAPYTPATLRGAWDQTAGAVTKALDPGTRGGGESTVIAIAETNVSTTFDVLLYRGVSGPLAAQTIAGTVDIIGGVFESSAAADMHWHLHLYVTQGNSDTPRGTILTDYVDGAGVNEWGTATAFKALTAAQALSSLGVSDGDRLVAEIGYISREASATSRTGSLAYGTLSSGKLLPDGAVAGTDTATKSGFLQFSQAIAFSASPSVRVSQVYLEVLSPNIPVVDDPPGGGTPPGAGVEPTNGTSLCGSDPVYKTVRVQTDSGEKRYSYGDLPLGNTFREARVLSIGPIRRALSDINGRIETARTTIVLSDYDGTLAGLAATGVLINKRVDVYAATDTQLRANATERRIASMMIRDFKFSGRKCSLQCEDYFGSVLGEYGAPVLVPKRALSKDDFPNLPIELYGKPVPIGYGLLSDESFGPNAIGVAPALFVGARRLSDGQDWDEYLVFGHAAASWQSIFASNLGLDSNLQPKPRPVKMDLGSLEGSEFLVPTYPGWNSVVGSDPFVDYNGHRYGVFYARGARSLDHRTGDCPMSVNLGGVEDVGDGTGTLIDALWLQILHFINNFWIQSYQTGNWLAYPTVNGTYSRIATLTFDIAQLSTADRLGQLPWSGGVSEIGYKGAWMLGQDGNTHPIATAMAQLARDGDGELGNDRHGRIMASVIDASLASVKTFTDVFQEIEEGSFDANRRIANLNNAVHIQYMRNYIPETRHEFAIDSARTATLWWADFWRDHGYPQYGTVEDEDATSIAAIGERRELTLEAWSLRDPATAFDIGEKKLERRKNGPIHTLFRTGLCGDDIDLGDNFKVTSEEGLAAAGWVAKLHRCEGITYYLDEDMVEIAGQVIA